MILRLLCTSSSHAMTTLHHVLAIDGYSVHAIDDTCPIYCKTNGFCAVGFSLQLAIEHAIAIPCVELLIDCLKNVMILNYTWPSIRQSFFCQTSCGPYSPKFFIAQVFYRQCFLLYGMYVSQSTNP